MGGAQSLIAGEARPGLARASRPRHRTSYRAGLAALALGLFVVFAVVVVALVAVVPVVALVAVLLGVLAVEVWADITRELQHQQRAFLHRECKT